MGYETTLYVGQYNTDISCTGKGKAVYINNKGKAVNYLKAKHCTCQKHNGTCFQVIAKVDLCKKGAGFESPTNTGFKIYFYGEDGNKRIFEDKYGVRLEVYSLDDTIKVLERSEELDPYRRTRIAIATLKAIRQDFKDT